MTTTVKFSNYYERWMQTYKQDAVSEVTYKKYRTTLKQIKLLVPDLRMNQLTRFTYQQLLNQYAENHERQTVMDFHHQLKGAILDAVDDGHLKYDPTRKAVIKGVQKRDHKTKYLSQKETRALIGVFNLGQESNLDYMFLLIIKTGLRFAEALAITPADFDFEKHQLSVTKTWKYKETEGGFGPTKNRSSNRKIDLDWRTALQFSSLVKNLAQEKPIFVEGRIHNDTVNDHLASLCEIAKIPIISVHGLRHTHASLLLYAEVSIASVAKRLGHSNMTTTQRTYLHIIQELANQDRDKIMQKLSGLF